MFRLAFRNIFRNKKRTIITLLSIVFSSGLIIFTRFLSYGTHNETIWTAVRLNTGFIQITTKGFLENRNVEYAFYLSDDTISEIKKLSLIKAISFRIESFGILSFKKESKVVHIIGMDPDGESNITVIKNRLIKGRWFNNNEKFKIDDKVIYPATLGYNLSNQLGVKIGDVLALVSTQLDGSIGAILIKVVGIFKAYDMELDSFSVYIPLIGAYELFGTIIDGKRFYTSIMIGLSNYRDVSIVYEKLKRIFKEPKDEYSPYPYTWKSLLPGVVQLVELDQIGTEISIAFLVLIVAFGVLNTIQMSIYERRKEFGILMAIGTSPYFLMGVVVLEAFLILSIGIVIGGLLGLAGGYYLEINPYVFSGKEAEAFVVSGFAPVLKAIVDLKELYIGVLSILIPSMLLVFISIRKILKFSPIEAIREMR